MIFSSNMSFDDYNFVESGGSMLHMNVADKRFFYQIIIWVFEILGGKFPFLGSIGYILFSFSSAAFILIIKTYCCKNLSSIPTIVFGLLFSNFPYLTDLMTFQYVPASLSIILLAGGLFLLCFKNNIRNIMLSIVVLIFAISYQPLIGFYLVVIFTSMLLITRNAIVKMVSFDDYKNDIYPQLQRILVLILSIFIYILLSALVEKITEISPNSRTSFATLYDAPHKAMLFIRQFQYFMLRDEVSIPISVKMIQIMIFAGLLLGIIKTIFESGIEKAKKLFYLWACLFFVLFMCISTMALLLFLKDSTGNLRSLSAFSMFWSAIFVSAWSFSSQNGKKAITVLGGVLAFCYILLCNNQAVDFSRINIRDRHVANRIVERLSLDPLFPQMRTVVFVGVDHKFNVGDIQTSTQGFNFSSLYWCSNRAVLHEVSGLKLKPPTIRDQELAKSVAEGKPNWPVQGSVFIHGDIGVVVMNSH
jgi:hypothetical protein